MIRNYIEEDMVPDHIRGIGTSCVEYAADKIHRQTRRAVGITGTANQQHDMCTA